MICDVQIFILTSILQMHLYLGVMLNCHERLSIPSCSTVTEFHVTLGIFHSTWQATKYLLRQFKMLLARLKYNDCFPVFYKDSTGLPRPRWLANTLRMHWSARLIMVNQEVRSKTNATLAKWTRSRFIRKWFIWLCYLCVSILKVLLRKSYCSFFSNIYIKFNRNWQFSLLGCLLLKEQWNYLKNLHM